MKKKRNIPIIYDPITAIEMEDRNIPFIWGGKSPLFHPFDIKKGHHPYVRGGRKVEW